MAKYDAIIVGARCAGAATAIGLAQRGYRVLLVDRAVFPSGTLSTHVFGDWEVFKRLGVYEEILDTDAPPIRRFRTVIEGCVLEADLVIAPFVLGLRRERLDDILVRRAASLAEVHWRPQTTVDALLWHGDRVAGVVMRSAGGRHEAHARIVIGADGMGSLVARAVEAQQYLTGDETRCAYYAYYEDVSPAEIPTFEFHWDKTDLILVIPCDAGLHCIAAMPPQSEFGHWRRMVKLQLDERLKRVPLLAPRFSRARRLGPVRGSGILRSYLRQPFGPGWALVGDAGACVHPCVGAGIDNAVACAEMLATTAAQWLSGAVAWPEAMAGYQQQRDARVRPVLEGALGLARRPSLPPASVAWFRLLCTMPGLAHELASRAQEITAGLAGESGAVALGSLVDAVVVELSGNGGRAGGKEPAHTVR